MGGKLSMIFSFFLKTFFTEVNQKFIPADPEPISLSIIEEEDNEEPYSLYADEDCPSSFPSSRDPSPIQSSRDPPSITSSRDPSSIPSSRDPRSIASSRDPASIPSLRDTASIPLSCDPASIPSSSDPASIHSLYDNQSYSLQHGRHPTESGSQTSPSPSPPPQRPSQHSHPFAAAIESLAGRAAAVGSIVGGINNNAAESIGHGELPSARQHVDLRDVFVSISSTPQQRPMVLSSSHWIGHQTGEQQQMMMTADRLVLIFTARDLSLSVKPTWEN